MHYVKTLKIQEGVIVATDGLMSVCAIQPVDVSLLTEDEQASFESNIRRALHSLGQNHAQIIVRSRNATLKDLDGHVQGLYRRETDNSTLDTIRAKYIENYFNELKKLVTLNSIPIQEFYLVLKVSLNTANSHSLVEGYDRLERLTNQVTSNLKQAKISTSLFDSDALKKYINESINPVV